MYWRDVQMEANRTCERLCSACISMYSLFICIQPLYRQAPPSRPLTPPPPRSRDSSYIFVSPLIVMKIHLITNDSSIEGWGVGGGRREEDESFWLVRVEICVKCEPYQPSCFCVNLYLRCYIYINAERLFLLLNLKVKRKKCCFISSFLLSNKVIYICSSCFISNKLKICNCLYLIEQSTTLRCVWKKQIAVV